MALSNLGVGIYELKDYEGAACAQREAIAAKPDFAEAHSNLGNALRALRRFDEATAAYMRATEINPNYRDTWADFGTTLRHSKSTCVTGRAGSCLVCPSPTLTR